LDQRFVYGHLYRTHGNGYEGLLSEKGTLWENLYLFGKQFYPVVVSRTYFGFSALLLHGAG
jgi:hypothetical protein